VVSFQGAVGAQSVSGAFLPSAGVLRGDDDAREHVSGDGRDVVAVRDALHRVPVLLWASQLAVRCGELPSPHGAGLQGRQRSGVAAGRLRLR
jgi:hypothetical protein